MKTLIDFLKVTDDTVTLSNPWSPEDHIEIIRSASEKAGNCHIKCGSSCPLPRIYRKFLANLPVVFQI